SGDMQGNPSTSAFMYITDKQCKTEIAHAVSFIGCANIKVSGLCGPLFGMTGSDQPFSVSSVTSVPSVYPLMAHPAFGLLSPATARLEFGGLGGLGISAALAAHPQLGAFTEWWRAAEAHGRSHPAFFPPFLGLPPMFAPPLHNHEANPYTSKTPSKSSQASKARKKQVEGSGVSESESGSSLDTDSDGVSSSDIDDLGEEEDDDDEDEDEQSKDSEESDSEKERQKKKKMKIVMPNPGLSKKEKTRLLAAKDFHRGLPGSAPLEPSPPVHLHRSPPPPGLSLSASRARERPLHTSVIQSTGLAASAKPLALIAQSRRDVSPKHSPQHRTSSPKTTSATTKPLTSSPQPLPLSLCSSPKPLSVPSPPKPLPLSSSPKPPPLTPSLKAHLPFSHGLLGLGQPNGVIQITQDVPLALTTKPRSDVPVNLSTGGRKSPASASPIPNRTREPRKSKTPKALEAWRGLSQNHLVQSLVDLFQHSGTEQKLPSSKDSDDSAEDEDDEDDDVEDDDEEDSDDSLSGSAKRKRVMNEDDLRIPLEMGWQRETRMKTVGGRLQGDVAYYAPCGKRLRQYPDVVKYLSRYGITDITRDNFSFSAKIRVGDFYEAREGPQGLQWTLLKEEEVIPHILAMEGQRSRPPNSERQSRGGSEVSGRRRRKGRHPNLGESEFPSPSEAKLLRKLEAQEIARQAAQMKLMRKLEKQALARAAKEARKQQAIMAAEERRKQKEQLKILKQQEKIKRIQQIRMEKELRAQQILEAKRKKREEAANAKMLEAEKRIKERERRRQHVMLMKAVEARKKAEERERLRQEKRDEKRLNKERKMELRRLELEMIREMKKPNEDMCLTDHKPLPEIPRIHGLVLPGSVFADCLMVVQFLRSFGKVLGVDPSELPTLGILQEGLLNLGNSMGQVQDLLVRLLSSAVSDPGLPQGHRAKSILGDHLTNVGLNRDNVSEVLQLYMEAQCSQTELANLTLSLRTKAFQAHTPAQKAAVLAFLVNELSCSKSVVSCALNAHILVLSRTNQNFCVCSCRMKTIYAKRTGKREAITGGEEPQAAGVSAIGHKRKRKAGDSDDDDDEDEDSEDAGDEDEDEEEEEAKKGKKVETCDEVKGLQQQNLIRRKLFESSHALRSMSYGQDRYRRRYWVLPQCGGVYIEGLESGVGVEELEKERERLRNFPVRVKEEPKEEVLQHHHQHDEIQGAVKEEEKPIDPDHEANKEMRSSPLKDQQETEVATTPPQPPELRPSQSPHSPSAEHTIPPPLQLGIPAHFLQPQHLAQTQLLANDQLLKVLSERSGHWFSLLPRSPCDDTSLLQPSAHPQSSPSSNTASTRPKTPPPPSTSSPPQCQELPRTPVGAKGLCHTHNGCPATVKPGGTLIGLPLGNWSGGVISPNPPLCSSPLHIYSSVEGSASPLLAPSVSTSKSGSPVPTGEKLISASSPIALDLPRNHDHPQPLPIPESDFYFSQQRVTDMEELKALVNALHSRGIRERALQKQLQKSMELITQTCNKNREVAVMEVSELDEGQVSVETLQEWCVEEQAMETDIALLQQVEELERKVTSASLQVKGWTYPEPQSEREDLVYYEHKALPKPRPGAESQEERSSEKGLVRRPSNPLDIAVARLAELERHIERRYLRSPLGTTIQIKLDNVGTVTVPAPAPSTSAGGEGGEEEIAPGMKLWRKALSEVRSSSQLAMCLQQLQKSIAWERSIMKVYCQMCRKGDNEDLLLLCDGCDKGCHTYCHKPKITNIPEGDWYCPACISKASGQSPKAKKTPNRAPPGTGGKKATEAAKKSKKQTETCEEEATSSNNSTPKKAATTSTQAKKNTSTPPAPKPDSPACVKRAKTARDNNRDLGLCRILLAELERHQDAWPFLSPVNLKSVPGYRKVIKKPMDFSTIREKLISSQ
uniref:Bromodomain adjacent to zinc finger domain protein 2B-like n=1 Tax=Sinocyclocheilus anshuiensis TaxID=1608454 RepID=A0A671KX15_9TELE